MTDLSRRSFLIGAGAAALGGCSMTEAQQPRVVAVVDPYASHRAMYGPMFDGGFQIPAVDLSKINPAYFRQQVANPTGEPAGTIVVDTPSRFLYLTGEGGTAIRYGIGIGREGFSWGGDANIRRKAEWPIWTPPDEMIAREPDLEKYRGGMEGSLENPLGARALYLYQGSADTLYRLHGTQEAFSIGHAVSSGCVRLLNQDVIDLHARVPIGTRVVVIPDVGAVTG